MSRSCSIALMLFVALGIAAVPPAFAQTPKPAEMKAEVPALDAMHEVIMPMWHDAWPNKDYKALAGMLPDIQKHVAAVAKAELPGILRDKQSQWAAGVADLQTAAAAYKEAVDKADNDALLNAAEKLHTQYEGLVKLVRPVLKEMQDFHASLYVLYHFQMSPFALDKATESIQALKAKMDPLNQATLPNRLKARTDAFTAQRARLSKALDALVATLPGRDEIKIREAIELMHAEYEKLDKVF